MSMRISFWYIPIFIQLVYSQCLKDQQSLLLAFKNEVLYVDDSSIIIAGWNQSVDCCNLGGITCDKDGYVTGLDLTGTPIHGELPDSIGKLKMLSSLKLRGCGFNGAIPDSIQNLSRLQHLDLSNNRFTGSIPSFQLAKNHLIEVSLNQNNLTGVIDSSQWEGFHKLEYLDLSSNSLSGNFPDSVLAIKSIQVLNLFNNSFSGQINDSLNFSSNQLRTLDLSSNKFEGPIPGFIFKLTAISDLILSSNKFTGRIELEMFGHMKDLYGLELSYNNLTINVDANNSFSISSLSKLNTLKLASCNVQQIPDLKNQSKLLTLDLSDNQLSGEIPNWIWEVGNGYLRSLNLSHNKLSSLQKPYTFPFLLDIFDLHSNNLEGEIPIPPKRVFILDYSNNNFGSVIPIDFGNVLTSTFFFSISNNNLVGPIPQSICNASNLNVLDLSNNSLNGTLPSCLSQSTMTLKVLNLRGNNLAGNILDPFPENCNIQTLDVSRNNLQGPLPQSLMNCKNLAFLDLGHNMITDRFPCWLNNLLNLHVFVIRGNRFHGNITCLGLNNLQIMDIASNGFSGVLPPKLFSNFQGIINSTQSKLSHLYFQHPGIRDLYYQDSVNVILKGTSRDLDIILNIFTSIDFSNNRFQGNIPVSVGELKLLKLVNLSHNALTGLVPMSIGKLSDLESLDLSVNKLSGNIPSQLASLSFLSFMNLSYNQLSGRIPRGSQFQTFTELSFKGNEGLCGMPLNKSCSVTKVPTTSTETSEDESGLYVSIGLGFVVGFVLIVGPLVCLRRWRTWYYNHVDELLSKIMKTKQERKVDADKFDTCHESTSNSYSSMVKGG